MRQYVEINYEELLKTSNEASKKNCFSKIFKKSRLTGNLMPHTMKDIVLAKNNDNFVL